MASLAVVLVTRRLQIKNIMFIGLGLAAVVYIVRLVPLTFGVHFIIVILTLGALLRYRLQAGLSQCLLTAILASIILAVSETLMLYFLSLITGVAIDQVIEDVRLHIFYAWPHIIVIFLLALLLSFYWKNRLNNKEEKNA